MLRAAREPPPSLAERNRRTLEHQGLVVTIALEFRGRGLPLDDLVQIGTIGLMRAAEKFDPARGRFSSYASAWVNQAIDHALDALRWPIHVPRHARLAAGRFLRIRARIAAGRGSPPGDAEVFDALGVPEGSRKRDTIAAAVRVLSVTTHLEPAEWFAGRAARDTPPGS